MSVPHSRRLAFLVASIVAIAACGGDSSTGPAATVTGSYSLKTVNGKPLPITMTDSSQGIVFQVTIMDPYTLTMNADRTFRAIATARVSDGSTSQVEVDTISGTYTVSGQQLTLVQAGSSPVPAQWNGSDTITLTDATDVLVFKK